MDGLSSMTTGSEIWNEFNQFLNTEIGDNLIAYYTRVLFEQATRAYDAGVHLGAAVLCRSSLETAFFLLLYGRWDGGEFLIDNPSNEEGKRLRISFETLKQQITAKVAFSKCELKTIDSVQEHGNLVAHFATLRIAGIQRWDENVIQQTSKLLQANPTPEGWRQLMERLERGSKIWVTPSQALDDLRDASLVLQTLFREATRRQMASMPNP